MINGYLQSQNIKHQNMELCIIYKDKKKRDDQVMVRSCGADASVVAS